MYMNMPSDNISYITMYVIAVYIIVQYILINGDIDTEISVYMAIAVNITLYMFIHSNFRTRKFFILLFPENTLKFKGKLVMH